MYSESTTVLALVGMDNAALLRELAIQAAVAHHSSRSKEAVTAQVSAAHCSFIESGFTTKAAWKAAQERHANTAADNAALQALPTPPRSVDSPRRLRREPHITSNWTEVFIDVVEAAACASVGASIAAGFSVLVVPAFSSAAECEAMLSGMHAFHEREGTLRFDYPRWPTSRTPVAKLDAPTQSLTNELLLRALEMVDADLPNLATDLFSAPVAAALRAQDDALITDNRALQFNKNEPAINVYNAGVHVHVYDNITHPTNPIHPTNPTGLAITVCNAGNGFSPHKDMHALTVLVPLVDAHAFEGGGTAFWSAPPRAEPGGAEGPTEHGAPAYFGTRHTWERGARSTAHRDWLPDAKTVAPTLVLRHAAGTALLFGGDVTHSGQPVTSGQRAVFVASFSRVCHRPMVTVK